MKLKYILIIILSILSFNTDTLFSFGITLYDVDPSCFPLHKAKYFLSDSSDLVFDHTLDDLIIRENGIPRKIKRINKNYFEDKKVSVIFILDIHTSMNEKINGVSKLDLQKKAVSNFINLTYNSMNDYAIYTLNENLYYNQDFTINKSKLINSLSKIKALEPNYERSISNTPIVDSYNIIKDTSKPTLLIYFTDANNWNLGLNNSNNAKNKIYEINFGSNLEDRINSSNYSKFPNVKNIESMYQLMINIAKENGMIQTNTIEWFTAKNCDKDSVLLAINYNEMYNSIYYKKNINSKIKLAFSPSFISINDFGQNEYIDTIINVSAINNDIIISEINDLNQSTNFELLDLKLPILIPANKTIQVKLRIKILNNQFAKSNFEFKSDNCSSTFSASFALDKYNDQSKYLQLIYPNGNEEFGAGGECEIRWEGNRIGEFVKLSYSKDNGLTWKLIANNIKGNSYLWKNIPISESNSYKIKVELYDSSSFHEIWKKRINSNKVKFSPDGKFIFSNFAFLDATTGKILSEYSQYFSNIQDIAFSSDSSMFVVLYSSSCYLYTYPSCQLIKSANTIYLHPAFTKINFSKDNKILYLFNKDAVYKMNIDDGQLEWYYDFDNELRIFEFGQDSLFYYDNSNQIKVAKISQQKSKVLSNLQCAVMNLSLSIDASVLLSLTCDSLVKVWDISKMLAIDSFKINNNNPSFFKISPDKKFLIVTLNSERKLQLWSLTDSKLIGEINKLDTLVQGIDFNSTNNNMLVKFYNGNIKMLNYETFEEISSFNSKSENINFWDFTPNGKQSLILSNNNTYLYDSKLENKIVKFEKSFTEWNRQAFSSDGTTVANLETNNNVILFETESGKIIKEISGLPEKIKEIKLNKNATELLIVNNNDFRTINIESQEIVSNLTYTDYSFYDISEDASMIAFAKKPNKIDIYKSKSKQLIASFNNSIDSIFGLQISQDNKYLFVRSIDRKINVFLIDSLKKIKSFETTPYQKDNNTEIKYNPETQKIYFQPNTSSLSVYDLKTDEKKDYYGLISYGKINPFDNTIFENSSLKQINYTFFQEDISDASFSIVKPKLKIKDFTVNSPGDTLIENFITNIGTQRCRINNIVLNYNYESDKNITFQIINKFSPLYLSPGEGTSIRVNFQNNFYSHYPISIIVLTQDDTIEIPFKYSIENFQIENSSLKFGKVKQWTNVSSSFNIINAKKFPMLIDSIVLDGPNRTDFKLLNLVKDKILLEKGSINATILFQADSLGRTSTMAKVYYDGHSKPYIIPISAEVIKNDSVKTEIENLEMISNTNKMKIYPNPISDAANIDIESIEKGQSELFIVNLKGEKVANLYQGELAEGKQTLIISTKDLSNGTYFVILQTATVTQKVKMEVVK